MKAIWNLILASTFMFVLYEVLHYKTDRSVNPGKGYEGRASLEKDCFKTGDLSLTITPARKADAGTYRCFVDDGTVKGNPHAYVLHVNEKRPSPGDQTDSNCITYKNFTIGFGIILGISVAVFVIYWITLKLHECQSTSATATRHEQNSVFTPIMPNISTTSPTNESQSVGNHPVQESDTTGNKPSNTRPF